MKNTLTTLLLALICLSAAAAKSDCDGYPISNFAMTVNITEQGDMVGQILQNRGKLGDWLENRGAVAVEVEKDGKKHSLSQFGKTNVQRRFPFATASYEKSKIINSNLKVKAFCPLSINDTETTSLGALMMEIECENPSKKSETFNITLTPGDKINKGLDGHKAEGLSYASNDDFLVGCNADGSWNGKSFCIPVTLAGGEKKNLHVLISVYDPQWISANSFDNVVSQSEYIFKMWDVLNRKTEEFSNAIPSTGIDDVDMYLRWYMIPAVSLTRCTKDGKILTLGYRELNPRDSYWTTWVHLVLFKDAERHMIEECLDAVTPEGKMPTTIMPLIERSDDLDINAFLILRAARFYQFYNEKDKLAQYWPTLKRAMDWLASRDSAGKGLPKQVSFWGDWKDVGGVSGREYSPFSCLIYLAALKEMMYLGSECGDAEAVAHYKELYDKGYQAINRSTADGGMWNGDFYCQLWKDGVVNDHLLEDQTIGILFDVVPADRAAKIIDALDARSLTPYGVAETTPYYPAEFGYAPATYHNGAVWPWVSFMDAWARMQMGRDDSAIDIIRRVGHADIVASGDWSANEHINSLTGENLGFHIQGWSAALFGTLYFGMLNKGIIK